MATTQPTVQRLVPGTTIPYTKNERTPMTAERRSEIARKAAATRAARKAA